MKIVTDDEITASKYYNNVTNTLDHITLRTVWIVLGNQLWNEVLLLILMSALRDNKRHQEISCLPVISKSTDLLMVSSWQHSIKQMTFKTF